MKRFLPFLPLAALVLASCDRAKSPAAAGGPQEPMPVMTQTPVSQKISDWDEFTSRIEAVDSVEIRPRITGYVDKVAFQAGQMVKAGDLLFEIDPRFEEAALATAPGPAAARILAFTRRAFRIDGDAMYLHDPLAVAAALDPTLVEWEAVRLEIGGDGATRRVPGPANCRVARRVDNERFLPLLLERLCPASAPNTVE